MTDVELKKQIFALKDQLGNRVIIPAHHYQQDDIVEMADVVGDSYKLAVEAVSFDADYIVFCGVRFMAEGADVLTKKHQKVLMPEHTALCPMAEMITWEQAEAALTKLRSMHHRSVVPVVYMNAHADMKAFCGSHGGAVCTSSNAQKVLEYYFSRDTDVFFFPDQFLGINTAVAMGLERRHIQKVTTEYAVVPVFDDDQESSEGASSEKTPKKTTQPSSIHQPSTPNTSTPYTSTPYKGHEIFVWDGFCPVHQFFKLEQIAELRQKHPDITIIVHPEVNTETAAAADMTGSTQQILNIIRDAPEGTTWGVGTEYNFVNRLAEQFAHEGKTIIPLYKSCCRNMNKTTLETLYQSLKGIAEGAYEEDNQLPADAEAAELGEPTAKELRRMQIVRVDEQIKKDAEKALSMMISIVQGD
ncbi:MAG: quinolinate synthase [Spirochaetales bacterium]|nr:quinolinate synthase [Spirochaetales bacterium]